MWSSAACCVSGFLVRAVGHAGQERRFVGFEIDVAKRLAKDLGVELQLVPTKWAGIIPALMAGKFDVIIGSMSVTPERNLKANFTVPYDYATIEVMANKEKTKGMKFPEDFNKPEVVVALRTGSTPGSRGQETLLPQTPPSACSTTKLPPCRMCSRAARRDVLVRAASGL